MDNCKPFMYSSKEMVFKHNSVECLIYRPFGANNKNRLKCSKKYLLVCIYYDSKVFDFGHILKHVRFMDYKMINTSFYSA